MDLNVSKEKKLKRTRIKQQSTFMSMWINTNLQKHLFTIFKLINTDNIFTDLLLMNLFCQDSITLH